MECFRSNTISGVKGRDLKYSSDILMNARISDRHPSFVPNSHSLGRHPLASHSPCLFATGYQARTAGGGSRILFKCRGEKL